MGQRFPKTRGCFRACVLILNALSAMHGPAAALGSYELFTLLSRDRGREFIVVTKESGGAASARGAMAKRHQNEIAKLMLVLEKGNKDMREIAIDDIISNPISCGYLLDYCQKSVRVHFTIATPNAFVN